MNLRRLRTLRSSAIYVAALICSIAAGTAYGKTIPENWAPLLHFHNEQFQITDDDFYLSLAPHTLEKEHNAAKMNLTGSNANKDLQCRFPARTWALHKEQTPNKFHLFSHCDDLIDYLQQVPVDEIALIFASENLASPSSMMGHVFLKLSGAKPEETRIREHAVSFFTNIDGINFPKLMFESIVTGKEGYFALTPYSPKEQLYKDQEKRNLWEFKLDYNEDQLTLLQLHLWEIKHTKLSYFFDTYNCATLTSILLRLAHQDIESSNEKWITPIDVAKQAARQTPAPQIELIPSLEWELRMLWESLPPETANTILRRTIEKNDERLNEFLHQLPNKQHFLGAHLATTYSKFAELPAPSFSNDTIKLRNDGVIDIRQYKSPLKTLNDSQVSYSINHDADGTNLKTQFLPAAIKLEDDTSQYFGDIELQLFGASLSYNLDNRTIDLDAITIYKAKAIQQYSHYFGGLSGEFKISIENQFNETLSKQTALLIGGGVGIAHQLLKPLSAYAIPKAYYGFSQNKHFITPSIELGLTASLKAQMKALVSVECNYNELGKSYSACTYQNTIGKQLNQDTSVFLKHTFRDYQANNDNEFSLELKRYF